MDEPHAFLPDREQQGCVGSDVGIQQQLAGFEHPFAQLAQGNGRRVLVHASLPADTAQEGPRPIGLQCGEGPLERVRSGPGRGGHLDECERDRATLRTIARDHRALDERRGRHAGPPIVRGGQFPPCAGCLVQSERCATGQRRAHREADDVVMTPGEPGGEAGPVVRLPEAPGRQQELAQSDQQADPRRGCDRGPMAGQEVLDGEDPGLEAVEPNARAGEDVDGIGAHVQRDSRCRVQDGAQSRDRGPRLVRAQLGEREIDGHLGFEIPRAALTTFQGQRVEHR